MLMGMCAHAAAEMEAAGQEVGSIRRALGKAIKVHVAATERYTASLAALSAAFPEPEPPKRTKAELEHEADQRAFAEGAARGWVPPVAPPRKPAAQGHVSAHPPLPISTVGGHDEVAAPADEGSGA